MNQSFVNHFDGHFAYLKNLDFSFNKHNMALKNKHKWLRDSDQDTNTESEIKNFLDTTANWPRFLVMELASVDLPLSKLSPFTIQKGFQAIASTIWRMGLAWWNALGNRRQWVFLRPLSLLIDPCMFLSTRHWTRHTASSAALSCPAWRRKKSRWNCRNWV